MKTLCIAAVLALSTVAAADVGKLSSTPRKLGREARVFVVDKEAPSLDKTVPLTRPRTLLKDK